MTPLDKLKQAAKDYANNNGAREYGIAYNSFIKGATSEAAREYWSSDSIGFNEWTNKNQFIWINGEWVSHKIEYRGCIYQKQELYQEFLKQKQK